MRKDPPTFIMFILMKYGGRGGIRRILLLFSVSEYTDYQANQAILDPTPPLLSEHKKGHF